MSDDYRRDDDPENDDWEGERDDESGEVPASVTFMEMMRHAAAKREARSRPAPERIERVVPETEPETFEPTLHKPTVRRVRRKPKRAVVAVNMIGGLIRTFIIVLVAAGLMATIFTWWTPNEFMSDSARASLSIAVATDAVTQVPTALPTPNWAQRIGIVAGHRGNDSGAVCPDGLTEASINLAVAERVVQNLRGMGYTVDLLDEFDPRLTNYQAAALVSIHSNTCQNFGETVSGYIIAASAGRISSRNDDGRLVECIAGTYGEASGLERRMETTVDMTDYHTFREINALTPAAIIELGFMLGDRAILTEEQDTLAEAISDGVLCYFQSAGSFQSLN